MRTKIAIIGSRSFCARAAEFTEDRPDIVLEMYPYRVPAEARTLLKELRPCDAILFSGSLPYLAAKELLPAIPVPAVYLKQDETEIAATLLAVSLRQPLQLSALSIDVRDPAVLAHVITASAPGAETPLVYALEEDYCLQAVVDFHAEARESGQALLAVTSVHAAFDRLQALGIPAVRMISVKSSFLGALDSLCQEALYQKSETAKIAAGILLTDEHSPDTEEISKQLCRLLHAHAFNGEDGILLYTTQGAIRAALKQPEFQYAAAAAKGKLAFGSGHTLTSAKEHAMSALRYMHADHPDGLYMMDEKKNLHNLLLASGETLELRVIEPVLAKIADTTALSPAVISKLALFGQSSQTMQFTANDLAAHLSVSRRTAERTIKKLLSAGYANTIGEEMTYRQGRPRSVYELSFPVY